MTEQLSLLNLVEPTAIIRPVDPDGHVVQGEPDETHVWKQSVCSHCRIEIHQHDDGLWMWSVSVHGETGGTGHKVGAKWGKFGESRRDAVVLAVQELRHHLEHDRHINVKRPASLLKWAAEMEARA